MQIGLPNQYPVSDFLKWYREEQLILNPDFQRRSVWNQDIRSYLINTLLRGFPMPKIYMRSTTDIVSQETIREVIDGQQRIKAIIDFATDKLRLNKRAGDFEGLHYSDLEDDLKQAFLSYLISIEQLINASDDLALEIFSRLNTYSVPLNAAELRNARFNGEFKFAVRELAARLNWFWAKYNVLGLRARLRMLDDEVAAEYLGVLLDGVKNGGKPYLDKLYSRMDATFPDANNLLDNAETIINFLDSHFSDALEEELFSRPPHLFILFAVVAHKMYGIPQGDLGDALPEGNDVYIDFERANAELSKLTTSVASDSPPMAYNDFVFASRGATVRTSSRGVRFEYVWKALSDMS